MSPVRDSAATSADQRHDAALECFRRLRREATRSTSATPADRTRTPTCSGNGTGMEPLVRIVVVWGGA